MTMSMPPPRSIHASLAAVNAARCWISSESIERRLAKGRESGRRPLGSLLTSASMSPKARADRRSQVPSVDALLRSAPGRRATARFGRALVKQALKETLEDVRAGASGGGELPSEREI